MKILGIYSIMYCFLSLKHLKPMKHTDIRYF